MTLMLCLVMMTAANVRSDESAARTDPQYGWQTQDWPMRGQNTMGEKHITTPFTNGPVPASSPSFGAPWKYKLPTHFIPGTFPPGVYGPLGSLFEGPAATVALPATSGQGPQGVLVAFADSGVVLTGPIGTTSVFWYGFTPFCGPYIGTPILIPDATITRVGQTTSGDLHVIGLGSECPALVHMKFTYVTCSGKCSFPNPVINLTPEQSIFHQSLQGSNVFKNAPARDGDVIYYASNNKCRFCGTHAPGTLYATSWRTLADIWTVPLQTGSGLTVPVPKGQPPPPAAEMFHATSGVAVNADLAVVGVEKYDSSDDATEGYALLAYNTKDGTQRWIYRVDAQVQPDPVVTKDFVIFGTANGRAYCLKHDAANKGVDGSLNWQVASENRLRYAPFPVSQGQVFSDTKLIGPALDGNETFAYFSGSDGAVHRFAVQSGEVVSTPPLLTYWDYSVDGNGAARYRPCPISTPPAICRNQCLAVEVFTQRYTSDVSQFFSYANGAYVCILPLPSMAWTATPKISNFLSSMRVDATSGVFVDNATNATFNAVKVGNAGTPVQQYDPILQLLYVLDPVLGLYINTDPFSGTDPYGGSYSPDGMGGVSFGSGYLIATDKGGSFWGIPSSVRSRGAATTSGEGPFPLGPPPFNPPLVLGPIEVYPNPYNPATAVGGTLKFKNLPPGSYVELYTLAYERVATLKEIGYMAHWDGKNVAGQIVAPGTYLYRIWLPDNKPPVTGRIALVHN